MKSSSRHCVTRALFCSAIALLSVACGGSSANTKVEDPPLLDQPSEEEQAPSSPAVQSAIEHIKNEQFTEAESILAKAVVDTPEDPQAAFFYGVALEGVGKGDEAEKQYRRAISLQPKLLESSLNLSSLLIDEKKFAEALKVTESALQYAEKDAPLLANRALALDMLGRPEAIGAYEQLLEVAPSDDANRFNYAVALFFIAKKGDAAKAELAKIKSNDPGLRADVDNLYAKIDELSACESFLSGADAAKNTLAVHTRKAQCKYMMEDDATAKSEMAAATALAPKATAADMETLTDLERLYVNMEDFAGCVKLWDGVVGGKKSADALAHRARCKLMQKDESGALADLKDAVKTEPKKAIGHFYLGKLQQKSGQAADAKKSFEAAAKAEPDSDFGKAASAELAKQ